MQPCKRYTTKCQQSNYLSVSLHFFHLPRNGKVRNQNQPSNLHRNLILPSNISLSKTTHEEYFHEKPKIEADGVNTVKPLCEILETKTREVEAALQKLSNNKSIDRWNSGRN